MNVWRIPSVYAEPKCDFILAKIVKVEWNDSAMLVESMHNTETLHLVGYSMPHLAGRVCSPLKKANQVGNTVNCFSRSGRHYSWDRKEYPTISQCGDAEYTWNAWRQYHRPAIKSVTAIDNVLDESDDFDLRTAYEGVLADLLD